MSRNTERRARENNTPTATGVTNSAEMLSRRRFLRMLVDSSLYTGLLLTVGTEGMKRKNSERQEANEKKEKQSKIADSVRVCLSGLTTAITTTGNEIAKNLKYADSLGISLDPGEPYAISVTHPPEGDEKHFRIDTIRIIDGGSRIELDFDSFTPEAYAKQESPILHISTGMSTELQADGSRKGALYKKYWDKTRPNGPYIKESRTDSDVYPLRGRDITDFENLAEAMITTINFALNNS